MIIFFLSSMRENGKMLMVECMDKIQCATHTPLPEQINPLLPEGQAGTLRFDLGTQRWRRHN